MHHAAGGLHFRGHNIEVSSVTYAMSAYQPSNQVAQGQNKTSYESVGAEHGPWRRCLLQLRMVIATIITVPWRLTHAYERFKKRLKCSLASSQVVPKQS